MWRECMGIEPTQPGVSRVACGFEDRDGHQAASPPLLHNDEPFGAWSQHFSDSSRPRDAGKIFADAIRGHGDEKATRSLRIEKNRAVLGRRGPPTDSRLHVS